MAKLLQFTVAIRSLKDDIYAAHDDAEANRQREFDAAVRIQSWYHAVRVRTRINLVVKFVRDLQRIWRGFRDRRHFRAILKDRLFVVHLKAYHDRAKLIQRVWRGYHSRKTIFDFYEQKRYLKKVSVKNEAVRKELRLHEKETRAKEVEQVREARRDAREQWAIRNHHLLSTATSAGIYSSNAIKGYSQDDIELMLRKVKLKPSENHLERMNPMFRLEKQLENDSAAKPYVVAKREPVLPPLERIPPKQQGPFKEMEDVLRQRYRPFNPSVRVQSDYDALRKVRDRMNLEEQAKQLDEPFKLSRRIEYSTLRPLHSAGAYNPPKYGNEHFRELERKPEAFKAFLPPIPLFDHFNDTYSQGTVGL